jgi:hypothetical protein
VVGDRYAITFRGHGLRLIKKLNNLNNYKMAKKVDFKQEAMNSINLITDELNSVNQEFQRFTDKGVKACLGRVRKHLMNIKRAAADGRKHVQEVRNSLK